MPKELKLKYGCNPDQQNARVYVESGELPIIVRNGNPGYINLLDALNAWQLVKELREALDLPAAASFKHVSPAGAAVGLQIDHKLRQAYFIPKEMKLSPLACAYARARGADRLSSFGDWAALSDVVDVSTAKLLASEVSDGVIAPGFHDEALEILSAKKDGKYPVIEIDTYWNPGLVETRNVFGITFEQERSLRVISPDILGEIVTANQDLPDEARRDLTIAAITAKYTQSNSICYAYDGQIIGVGAGQQSRIHCTRLAGDKADRWWLRQHPLVLDFKFKEGINRADMNNALDIYFEAELTDAELLHWETYFEKVPHRLSDATKHKWLKQLTHVSVSSDAFFPFRDSIDRASRSGVSFVVQPGGSQADEGVIEACDEYGMVMVFSDHRLFHH